MDRRKTTGIALLALAGSAVVGIAFGTARWKRRTRDLRRRLEVGRIGIAPAVYDPEETEGLPEPVRRYFRAVLTPGQPMIAAADLVHHGRFNARESGEPRWQPFTSVQRVVTQRAGFVWDGRVPMAPGMTAFVHDAYLAGEGVLHAELLGLVPVADLRGTPEIARGELLRFLAEAVWYPTRLLPSQGVRWEAIDQTSARATIADGAIRASLDFHFDEDGLVRAVYAAARPRTVGGVAVETPWEGRFGAYASRGGARIPLEGEVAWLPPEGRLPYWRGHVARVSYEFAR